MVLAIHKLNFDERIVQGFHSGRFKYVSVSETIKSRHSHRTLGISRSTEIVKEESVRWNGMGIKLTFAYLQLPTSNQGYYYWNILKKNNGIQKEEQEEEVEEEEKKREEESKEEKEEKEE